MICNKCGCRHFYRNQDKDEVCACCGNTFYRLDFDYVTTTVLNFRMKRFTRTTYLKPMKGIDIVGTIGI